MISPLDREDTPVAGNAFERTLAAVKKSKPRARHEVLYSAGDQNFVRARKRCDASADMDGYAADIISDLFAFSGTEPRANFEPKRPDVVGDRARATDRSRRTVERDQESIAKSFDLTSAKAQDIPPDGGLMRVDEIAPTAIAKRCGFLRRTGNVSKKDRREHPVGDDLRFRTGQEIADQISNFHSVVAYPKKMVDAREFDIARAGNVCGQKASTFDVDGHITCAMDDQGCTRIDDTMSLTSIWLFMRIRSATAAGLAPSRSNRPHQFWKAGSPWREGAKYGKLAPLPQP
jgi:hypothetical protein